MICDSDCLIDILQSSHNYPASVVELKECVDLVNTQRRRREEKRRGEWRLYIWIVEGDEGAEGLWWRMVVIGVIRAVAWALFSPLDPPPWPSSLYRTPPAAYRPMSLADFYYPRHHVALCERALTHTHSYLYACAKRSFILMHVMHLELWLFLQGYSDQVFLLELFDVKFGYNLYLLATRLSFCIIFMRQ